MIMLLLLLLLSLSLSLSLSLPSYLPTPSFSYLLFRIHQLCTAWSSVPTTSGERCCHISPP